MTILGPTNLPSRLAADASEMYARTVASLLGLLIEEGALELDLDNEILDGACVTHAGEVRHPWSRRAMGME